MTVNDRQEVTESIKALVQPYMHDSGYRKAIDPSRGIFGGTRPLRMWAPNEAISIDGFALEEVIAITEDGIIDDASGGGAMQSDYDCFPLEDLIALRTELETRLAR